MYDKRKPLPLPHVMLAFEKLADFHGKWLRWIHLAKNGNLKAEGNIQPVSYETFKVLNFFFLNETFYLMKPWHKCIAI